MRQATWSEIHEQEWFPARLRDDVTDALQWIFNAARLYRPIAARLGEAIRASGTDRVIDLCSGAGGPWTWLRAEAMNGDGAPLRVTLTDRFPNAAAFRRLRTVSGGAIDFSVEPVDAQSIAPALCGFRTMFSTLHHFTPDEIVAILRDAASRGQGIGFFELAKRRPRTIVYACFMPLAAIFLVPFMRPFRFARLIWTYLLPVIPFVLLWDGVLSCLRAYTPEELREIAARAGAKDYTWEIGESGAVTYFIGYKEERRGRE
jgi:hypothetical protein